MEPNPRWPGIGGVTGQLIFLLLSTIAIIFFKLGSGELLKEFEDRMDRDDD